MTPTPALIGRKPFAYYNEFDAQAAAWLRELIRQGLIADGEVDERSIEDVAPIDLSDFTQCHFFAGIGGWNLALRNAGWSDDRPVWSGSCPCQPFSAAGEGAGFADERHLWPAFHWLIERCRPAVVFGEQVASADGLQWLDLVSADLEGQGYTFGAADLCAAGVGAPHTRQRLYWVAADTCGLGRPGPSATERSGSMRSWWSFGEMDLREVVDSPFVRGARHPQPLLRCVDDGLPGNMGALRGFGNAIVPQNGELFIRATGLV